MQNKARIWRGPAAVIGMVLVGALLGFTAAPIPAQAAADPTYKCSSEDKCTIGTKECCTNNFGGTGHCSTNCPIIIEYE